MKKSRRCLWLAVGVVIAGMLVGGCRAVTGADEEGLLAASGTIRADEVRLASELGGRIVEVRARAGAQVQAGDLLVVLDSTPLLTGLAEAEAAVAAAQADLAVVRAGPRVEEIAAVQAALALAGAQRDGTLAAWENAQEALENPQELDAQIAKAGTDVKLAAQGVELAEAQLARERLWRDQRPESSVERQVADGQVRAAEEALAAAQADEKTAQTTLDWLWLMRNEPLGLIAQAHAAEGQYRLAEQGMAVAQARLDDLLAGPTAEEIAVAEATVRLAQAQADVLRTQLARFTLTSPVDGVVLDQALRAGEIAAPVATILTVADLNQVVLSVYVPENRIGQVRLGQPVQVTVDSFPGKIFAGQVTRIGDEPEFTPRNVATKEERLNTFYAVEVRLSNPEGLLKPGMPADASF
ncbi:MAG: efflux RND transporter periplasmic adaptor subunit [Anaerolineae bacterium]|nr:MAG: efflux RND transporter periplasmic adaptor subunit [Anaerolineae bacterium]